MKGLKTKIVPLVFSFVFMISCAGMEVDPNDPNAHIIKGIKQVYQGRWQCAASCMTMVLRYYGVEANRDKIDAIIRSEGGRSVPGYRMAEYAHSHGLQTEKVVEGSDKEVLKKFLSRDIPLIVRVDTVGGGGFHYVVLVGYTEKGFITRDPQSGLRIMNYKYFKKVHEIPQFHINYYALAIYRK